VNWRAFGDYHKKKNIIMKMRSVNENFLISFANAITLLRQ